MVLSNVLHETMESIEIIDYFKGLPYVYFWESDNMDDPEFPHERMKMPLVVYMNKAILMIRSLENSIWRNGYLLELSLTAIRSSVYTPYTNWNINEANKNIKRINYALSLIKIPQKVAFKLTNEALMEWTDDILWAIIWDLENNPISNIMEVVKSAVPK